MPFDPDQYLNQPAEAAPRSSVGLDPDAYLSGGKPASQAPQEVHAAADHFSNVMTLGYLPQIEGGLTHAALAADDYLHGTNNAENVPYVKLRDDSIRRLKDEDAQYPLSSGAGKVAGVASSMYVNPAGSLLKGGSLGAQIAKAGAYGGAYGALQNPGDVEGEVDPVQAGPRAKNAAFDAAGNAALAGVIGGAGKLLGKRGPPGGGSGAAGAAQDFAEEKAFKAAGPMKKDFLKAQDAGRVNDYGRQLLDDGIVTPLASPAKIASRLQDAKSDAGDTIGTLLDSADQAGAPKVSASNIALDLSQDPSIAGLSKVPGKESIAGQVDRQLNTLYGNGDNLSLRDAQKLRQGIDDSINFNKRVPEMSGSQPYLYDMRDAVRGGMNDSINQLPNFADKDALLTANRRYSNLSDLERMASNKEARDSVNRMFGLTDTIAGGAGAETGAVIGHASGIPGAAKAGAITGGAIGAIGNKLGRTYGNPLMATGADALSKVLAKGGSLGELVANNPQAGPALMQMIDRKPGGAQSGAPPIDPQIMDMIRANPGLIDRLSDENLKAQLRRYLAGQ